MTTKATLSDLRRIAMTDVVNAATWVLVVLILWADVWLQIGGRLSNRMFHINAYLKGALYMILVVAAFYWVWFREWVDALDAFLWLLAFFVIELNLFNWHEEANETQADHPLTA